MAGPAPVLKNASGSRPEKTPEPETRREKPLPDPTDGDQKTCPRHRPTHTTQRPLPGKKMKKIVLSTENTTSRKENTAKTTGIFDPTRKGKSGEKKEKLRPDAGGGIRSRETTPVCPGKRKKAWRATERVRLKGDIAAVQKGKVNRLVKEVWA